jgi:beta-glucosidase
VAEVSVAMGAYNIFKANRNLDWEGFGSDPVLQAFGGALSIEGIQSVGVVATLKHLIANEQEQYRMYSVVKPGISSNLDDRTMHELYLWPFAEGVRSGVGSVMIAYNAVSCYT